MDELIFTAITRRYTAGEWRSLDATALAVNIVEDAKLVSMTRFMFFQQVIAAGGEQSEIAGLYGFAEFVKDLDRNILAGHLAEVTTLASLAGDLVSLSTATSNAINQVISDNSLTWVEIVASELGQIVPASVSASDVTTAIEAKGLNWAGGAWV